MAVKYRSHPYFTWSLSRCSCIDVGFGLRPRSGIIQKVSQHRNKKPRARSYFVTRQWAQHGLKSTISSMKNLAARSASLLCLLREYGACKWFAIFADNFLRVLWVWSCLDRPWLLWGDQAIYHIIGYFNQSNPVFCLKTTVGISPACLTFPKN